LEKVHRNPGENGAVAHWNCRTDRRYHRCVQPPQTIDCLVPAAGQSARMGSWKPLLPFGHSSIVETVVANALCSCRRVLLVAGYRGEELAARFAGHPRVTVVHNPDWPLGMFSSLQAGIRLAETPWLFITLGDMPWISPDVYAALLRCPREGDAVFPVHGGRRGHPVLIGPRMKEAALCADPASGSMRRLAELLDVAELPWGDDSIHRDIDTTGDRP
jgi:molybdenum cofactor cytidylyltransferase